MEMEQEQIIALLKEHYSNRGEVCFGFLFGSYAVGRAGKNSDIDIGVFLQPYDDNSFRYKMEETPHLQELFRKPVDLIIMNEAPPLLVHEIFKHGISFLDRRHELLVDFRVANFYKYLDQRYIINHFFVANVKKLKGQNPDGQ